MARKRAQANASPHNLVHSSDGSCVPAPGYDWVDAHDPRDSRVVWSPGKAWPGRNLEAGEREGAWLPAPGYGWIDPGDLGRGVEWLPGVEHRGFPYVLACKEEGRWRAAPGYRWLNNVPGDYRVVRDDPGGAGGAERGSPGVDVQRIKDLAMLGLGEGAAWTEIEAGFRRLAKLHHPDRFAAAGREAFQAAQEAFVLLRSAYERLRAAR